MVRTNGMVSSGRQQPQKRCQDGGQIKIVGWSFSKRLERQRREVLSVHMCSLHVESLSTPFIVVCSTGYTSVGGRYIHQKFYLHAMAEERAKELGPQRLEDGPHQLVPKLWSHEHQEFTSLNKSSMLALVVCIHKQFFLSCYQDHPHIGGCVQVCDSQWLGPYEGRHLDGAYTIVACSLYKKKTSFRIHIKRK